VFVFIVRRITKGKGDGVRGVSSRKDTTAEWEEEKGEIGGPGNICNGPAQEWIGTRGEIPAGESE